jgi:hypothetical protein
MRDDALDLLLVCWIILSLIFFLSFRLFYRKCLSTILYDVYRLNNVLIIPISNNSIHTIYLYRHPLLYLLSKREPSDTKYVCVNCYVRYFFPFPNWYMFLYLSKILLSFSLLCLPYSTYNCWLICSFFFSFFHHRSHIDFF